MKNRILYEHKNREKGISGIMRIRNDAQFIAASVDSCIDALDELIIVYNQCTDNSAEIIRQKQKEYPEKIKIFEYKPKVYSVNLTYEDYIFAKNLPENSEHLLCNYYNFALSKISYKYVVKIDADQIYFTSELKKWCDIYRSKKKFFSWKVIPGIFIWGYIKFIKNMGNSLNKVFPLYPYKISKTLFKMYEAYAKFAVANFDAQVSLAGINVFYNNCWYVTMGKCTNKDINILPPFNGTGDHIIFKATSKTYYSPFDSKDYIKQRSDHYALIEQFKGACLPIPIGLFWYHLNTMRKDCQIKLNAIFSIYKEYFVKLDSFSKMNYQNEIEKIVDKNMSKPNERALFQFLHLSTSESLYQKYLNKITQFQ